MKNFKFHLSTNPTYPRSELETSDYFGPAALFSNRPTKFIPTKNESLYTNLRRYLILGRILGIIPLKGVFTSNVDNLQLRFCSQPYITSVSVTVLLVVCMTVSTFHFIKTPKNNAADLAYGGTGTVFFMYASFIYLFFLRNSKQLIFLLKNWESVTFYFSKQDLKLRKHFALIVGIIFTSAVLENAVFHIKTFPVLESNNTASIMFLGNGAKSPLEVYYEREFAPFEDIIPYNPVLAIILFFANKFAIYAWNYADILIALISRAIYFKFKALTESAGEQALLLYGDTQSEPFWNFLVEDHNTICQILEKFADFLSPLIFASYFINIYITCILVHQAFTPSKNNNIAATLYNAWSFFQMTGRVFVFSLAAARVNEFAHAVRKLYISCPNDCYSLEVKRSELRVNAGGLIALHGLKCFFITKQFLLTIVSVIFTFEIVLLQTAVPA